MLAATNFCLIRIAFGSSSRNLDTLHSSESIDHEYWAANKENRPVVIVQILRLKGHAHETAVVKEEPDDSKSGGP